MTTGSADASAGAFWGNARLELSLPHNETIHSTSVRGPFDRSDRAGDLWTFRAAEYGSPIFTIARLGGGSWSIRVIGGLSLGTLPNHICSAFGQE
jgi:hypothetical protein